MISVVPVTAQSLTAHDEAPERSLVGVWLTQVTRRNCDTGEPIGATSQIQLTFAEGGTLLAGPTTTVDVNVAVPEHVPPEKNE